MSLLVLQNGKIYHNKHVIVLHGNEDNTTTYSSGDDRKILKAIYLTGDKNNKLFETFVNALELSIKSNDVNADTLFNLYTHLNELSEYTLGEVVFSLCQFVGYTPVNTIWYWDKLINRHHRFIVSGMLSDKHSLVLGTDAWTLQAKKTYLEKEIAYKHFFDRNTLMDYLLGINQCSYSDRIRCLISYMHLLFGSDIELKEETLLANLTRGI